MSGLTGDLLAAVVAATPDRGESALRVLRDEVPQPAARPTTGPLLLGMGAAAKFLGVSRSTLWRVLRAGTIQRVELFPGSFRVRREDLEALAAGTFGLSESRSRRGRPPRAASENAEQNTQGALRPKRLAANRV